jgi:hypothetical protein
VTKDVAGGFIDKPNHNGRSGEFAILSCHHGFGRSVEGVTDMRVRDPGSDKKARKLSARYRSAIGPPKVLTLIKDEVNSASGTFRDLFFIPWSTLALIVLSRTGSARRPWQSQRCKL